MPSLTLVAYREHALAPQPQGPRRNAATRLDALVWTPGGRVLCDRFDANAPGR